MNDTNGRKAGNSNFFIVTFERMKILQNEYDIRDLRHRITIEQQ